MRKRLFIGLFVLCCMAVAVMIGYRSYRLWRHRRLLQQARQSLAASDVRSALLCLQRAVRSDPFDAEAWRMLADFAEENRLAIAPFWRERVVELEPTSLTNRLLWARSALTMGDTALARKALDSVDEAGKRTAAYHKTAGAIAVAKGQLADAEWHFREASLFEPHNVSTRVNLAVIQLQKGDSQAADKAREELEALCANAAVRGEVLRQLLIDALRRKESASALSYAGDLLRDTNSVFGDRLLHLEALRLAGGPQFSETLKVVQDEAVGHPAQTYDLARWMLVTGAPKVAIAWLESLPSQVQTNLPLPIVLAECYLAAGCWPALMAALQDQDWGELEFVRWLYRARALKAQGMETAAKAEWAKCVKAAGRRLERLVVLVRSAGAWNWLPEREEILWLIVNGYPGEKWAIRDLADSLHATGKTRSLLTLFTRAVEADPDDLPAKNNLAMTAMLVNAWEKRPHDLAKELYVKAPSNPFYVSTYAFSLHLQDKDAEAAQVLERLDAGDLENPLIAAYCGIILEALGNKAKASEFLDLAAKARLLPEEDRLVDRAKRRIR
jgi:tetratricopeptide (TPR) repeat protein